MLVDIGLILSDPFYQPTEGAKAIGHLDPSIQQSFPPLAGTNSIKYGLSVWHSDWIHPSYIENIKKVGWNKFFVSSGYHETLDETAMANMIQYAGDNNADFFYSLLGYARDEINPTTGTPRFNTDEEFIQSYLDYIDTVLGRYGPGGTYFTEHPAAPNKPILIVEVWDEPSYLYRQPESWNDPVLSDFDHQALVLAKLLSATYHHLHANATWEAAGIKMQGISPVREPDMVRMVHQHVKELRDHNDHLEPGASITPVGGGTYDPSNFYDIVSLHPYSFDGPPDTEYVLAWYTFSWANYFKSVRTIMDDFGNSGKPIEICMGWHRDQGRFSALAARYPIPEFMQAAYVIRAYAVALRSGLESYNAFHIIDADNYNGGFFDIAMGDDGYWHVSKWWAQTTATATMIHLMPRPKINNAISDGVNGYYAYTIDPDSNASTPTSVIMAWNVEKPLFVTVPCSAGDTYTVYNMLGYTTGPQRAISASISLKIGPYPVFVLIEK